jgi:hypothetical protein
VNRRRAIADHSPASRKPPEPSPARGQTPAGSFQKVGNALHSGGGTFRGGLGAVDAGDELSMPVMSYLGAIWTRDSRLTSQGVFEYRTLTTDLDMIGMWTCTVVISAQGFHATYAGEIGFQVVDQPD